MQKKFYVTGMTCSACQAAVERSVKKLAGVQAVNVNLLANKMTVEFDDALVDADAIVAAVEKAGYEAGEEQPAEAAGEAKAAGGELLKDEIREMRQRVFISFVFLIPLMYIAMGEMVGLPLPSWLTGLENALTYAFVQFLLTLPIVYINRKYYQNGFKTLLRGSPNMDSLIAIGSSAAVIYGIFAIFRIGYGLGHGRLDLVEQYSMDIYFETGGMILALITLGKYLEARSKGRTSEAISKLLDLAPKTAVVERNGRELEIPVEEIAVGDLVVIRPGQSIPVDGVIVEGSTAVDQAAITGESIPVEKTVGDRVISASINKTGFIKFRAEKVGDDTTLAQIIQLVEEAGSSKAPIAKLADRISGIFVPVVIAIAVVATIVWLLLEQVLNLLWLSALQF